MSNSPTPKGRPGHGSRILAAMDKARAPYSGVAGRVAARLVAEDEAAAADETNGEEDDRS
ncbi:hypothetical protein [Kitasatospora viridis]|uniref:Uncharacterized protein n=1 Tax=Kitasatospora viridis TaxID=281105 RepID=A0A561UBW5_9ACTN|nr:hypothetical protein [Kitasatospora viridis]TWF96829.1 hypothetical protein FHX73_11602 [Kitasatospora viridis]